MKKNILILTLVLSVSGLCAQQHKVQVESWMTTADRSDLLQKQPDSIFFSYNTRSSGMPVIIDSRQEFQPVDGFGFALTGGSAQHLVNMSRAAREKLLRELFSPKAAGFSYIRLSIGASDLNSFVFSYNDLKEGETDADLKKFSLSQDLKDVVPIMKEILAIHPGIKIMGSPWSAPAWMKTNNNVRGGALKKEYYAAYALYFVKYIQAMKREGINIDAITVQNEPLNSRNTPSMQWFYEEQGAFIKDHLGPAFAKAGIKAKIILFDHNCDRIDYPLALLSDPDVAKYVDGSGFHHYGGDIGAMSTLHLARPDKNLYFTEQMVVERGGPDLAIAAYVKRLLIGTMRNWSRNLILWNLAADPNNDPHTDNGGCSMCQGAITIAGDSVKRNVAYYTIAHASAFVPMGSVRIASTYTGDRSVSLTEDEERKGIKRATVIENTAVLPNVAFKTPEGKIVLIVANDTYSTGGFSIQYNGAVANLKLPPGAVGTYVFKSW